MGQYVSRASNNVVNIIRNSYYNNPGYSRVVHDERDTALVNLDSYRAKNSNSPEIIGGSRDPDYEV
jgi:hypothetical protein